MDSRSVTACTEAEKQNEKPLIGSNILILPAHLDPSADCRPMSIMLVEWLTLAGLSLHELYWRSCKALNPL